MGYHLRSAAAQREQPVKQGGGVLAFIFTFLLGSLLIVIPFLFWPKTLLQPVGNYLVVDQPPIPSSAIVILLGGESAERVVKAVALYREGHSDRVVFGSGFVDRTLTNVPQGFVWPTASSILRIALESALVNSGDIVTVNTEDAFDTSSELEAIAAKAREEAWPRVILVSSATHTKRVQIIWERIAPDISAVVVAARPERVQNWWLDSRIPREVAYEYGALLKEYSRRIARKF
ncbi:MAG: YdcF family protein [Deltaproteobacteria bacterium]|nr:YdcF family protein [Deltaproteobacteria bacterium]